LKRRIPGPGEIVLFVPRPGEGRGHLIREFPAIVMRRHERAEFEDEVLDLFVIFGVEDYGDRNNIPEVNADHPFPGWKRREVDEEREQLPLPLMAMPPEGADLSAPGHLTRQNEAAALRGMMDELAQVIYGPFEKPEKAMIEYLAEFEAKLKDFGKRLRKLEATSAL
jgi:hypothetical protein